jgi:hypothetical protein
MLHAIKAYNYLMILNIQLFYKNINKQNKIKINFFFCKIYNNCLIL